MSKARDRGFKEVTKIEDARRIFYEALPSKSSPSELVPVPEALNRILAEDVKAETSVPSFDKAAMDGYAAVAEDTFGASQTNPSLLRMIGESKIGETPRILLHRGETAAIATGAPVPQGANAVVMIENAKRLDTGHVEVYSAVAPSENVSQVGEDVRQGTVVLEIGRKLKPPDLGLLVALSRRSVRVVRKPRVGVLSTGNELSAGKSSGGKIVDVNRPTLMAMVEECGGMPVDLGIAKDDPKQISQKVTQGLTSADLVLVTAGTSVGKGDLVPDVINALGKPGMLVHGIAMRPSLPTGLAVVNGKPVVSLPGLPVSAMFAFSTFVQPLILKMLGAEPDPQAKIRARTTKRIVGVPGFRTFIRVRVKEEDGKLVAEPLRTPGSGVLTTLTRANGIVVVPENVEGFDEGAEIEVQLFRPVERGESAGRP